MGENEPNMNQSFMRFILWKSLPLHQKREEKRVAHVTFCPKCLQV
jgi:hypothetical protein